MSFDEDGGYAQKSKYIDEQHIVPHFRNETKEFINYLIDYAKEQDEIPVLIPCHDSYVEVIDEHLHVLKEYYYIPQTEQGLYTQLMDKGTLAQIAEKHNMKIPETVYLGEENFYEKIDSVISYPCL